MFSLMFGNKALEYSFRRRVQSTDEEIGGYFMAAWRPASWPGKFRFPDLYKALPFARGIGLRFIESIVIIPNEATRKKVSWSAWDIKKAREIADDSAGLVGGYAVHFHTHPNGSGTPSPADYAFAGANCQAWPGFSQFVIVTPKPYVLHPYTMEFDRVGLPESRFDLQGGHFISWRQRELWAFYRALENKGHPEAAKQ